MVISLKKTKQNTFFVDIQNIISRRQFFYIVRGHYAVANKVKRSLYHYTVIIFVFIFWLINLGPPPPPPTKELPPSHGSTLSFTSQKQFHWLSSLPINDCHPLYSSQRSITDYMHIMSSFEGQAYSQVCSVFKSSYHGYKHIS